MKRLAAILPILLALPAVPAAADTVLRFVQIAPDGEPIGFFEIRCGAARCSGTARIIGPDGQSAWIVAEGRPASGVLHLALRVEGSDVSTAGAIRIVLRDGRAVLDVPLVRGWRPDPSSLRDGVWRRAEPAGIRLRVAIGPGR